MEYNCVQPMDVYQVIEEMRLAKGWSQDFLCKKAGISINTFQNWKARKKVPGFDVLQGICHALDISISQLFLLQDTNGIEMAEAKLLAVWRNP